MIIEMQSKKYRVRQFNGELGPIFFVDIYRWQDDLFHPFLTNPDYFTSQHKAISALKAKHDRETYTPRKTQGRSLAAAARRNL